jgi:hypothetical protein
MKNNLNNTLFYIFTGFLLLFLLLDFFNYYYYYSPLDGKASFFNLGDNSIIYIKDLGLSDNKMSNSSSFSNKFPVYKFRGQSSENSTNQTHIAEPLSNNSQDQPQVPIYHQTISRKQVNENSSSGQLLQIDGSPASNQVYTHQNSEVPDLGLSNINISSLGGLFAQQDFSNEVYLKDNSFNTNNTLALTTDVTSITTSQLVDGDPGDPGIPVGDGYAILLVFVSIFTLVKRKSSSTTCQLKY